MSRAFPSRANTAFGLSILQRAAASLSASGSPSRRWQIAAMSPQFSSSSCRPGRTSCAYWTNICTAPDIAADSLPVAVGSRSGGTGCSCSACTCSGCLEDATTVTRGARVEQVHDERARVVDLLEVVEHEQRLAIGEEVEDHRLRPSARREIENVGQLRPRCVGGGDLDERHEVDPVCEPARLVGESLGEPDRQPRLPGPPGPVRVTTRTSVALTSAVSSASSPSRPTILSSAVGRLDDVPRVRSGGNSDRRPTPTT